MKKTTKVWLMIATSLILVGCILAKLFMLNLHATFTKGTVEFRLFQFEAPTAERRNGLHAGQLKSYIQLCLALSQMAKTVKTASPKPQQNDNPKYAMPDFMAGLARGIEQSRGAVRAAIDSVADDLAFTPTVSVAAGSLDALKTGSGRYTETATADRGSDLSTRLDAMYEVVTKYLPRLASRQIVLDSGTLVGELSDGMNRTLGRNLL